MITYEFYFHLCLLLRNSYGRENDFLTECGDGNIGKVRLAEKYLLCLQQQHIGSRMHEQAKLVGGKLATGHAVGREPVLQFLYVHFAVIPVTVPTPVKMP